MLKGLGLGVCAMVFFGMAFVLPLFVPNFSALEVALGRYIVYGLFSCLLLFRESYQELKRVLILHWKKALLFTLSGFIGYYFLLVLGMRYAGAALGTLVNGALLPIAASLYANYRNKDFSFVSLLPSLLLVFVGLGVVHFEFIFSSTAEELVEDYFGVALVLAAVALWAWFSVNNGAFLRAHQDISSSTWSSLIGILCLLTSLVISAVVLLWNPEALRILDADVSAHELKMFVWVSLVLGIVVSWLTTFLWSKASCLVPMSLLGQLIALEGVFGLSYILLFERSWPSNYELIGVVCILSGLLLSFQLGRRRIPKFC